MTFFDHRRGHGEQYRGGNRDHTETITVPRRACGLIVGTGGRNVKELQQDPGIRHINVDFVQATVKIVGTEAGILVAKRRIEQAVSIATNAAAYFPQRTLTCLRLKTYSKLRFDCVSKSVNYCVLIEQLDANREYFLLNTVGTETDLTLGTLRSDEIGNRNDTNGLTVGFGPSTYKPFLEGVIRQNLSDLSDPSLCTSIKLSFGKTFLSSVPADIQQRPLAMDTVQSLKYGKGGLRPEFVRHLPRSKRELFLSAIKNDYVHLSSGRFTIVHCISKMTKKRYTIKLHHRDEDNEVNEAASSGNINQIAAGSTYFEGLDINAGAARREVNSAHQGKALHADPSNNNIQMVGKETTVLKDARDTLISEQQRRACVGLPVAKQRPKNNFEYVPARTKPIPLPKVETFRSGGDRLALYTVLSEGSRSEFRTLIETEKDEAMDHAMRSRLQDAWDKRTRDNKLHFTGGIREDWLIVDMVRYKESMKLTNGTFILTLDDVTEDHFGKSCSGLNVSLDSYDAKHALVAFQSSVDKDKNNENAVSLLLASIVDLQHEAEKISRQLDEL